VTGLARFPVFVLFTDDGSGELWELSPDACERLADRLARHVTCAGPAPTADELLAVAMGET